MRNQFEGRRAEGPFLTCRAYVYSSAEEAERTFTEEIERFSTRYREPDRGDVRGPAAPA